jgi:phosphoserine phosphatase
MSKILSLISSQPVITPDFLDNIRKTLPESSAPVILNPRYAAEIMVSHADLSTLKTDLPIDFALTSSQNRRKKLLIADMDSTMIEQECIDELADYVGKKAHVSEITERAMRGEIAFEPALRERVLLLKGLPFAVIDEVIASKITLMAGGKTLIATMKANGAYTALVSGGFTLFTAKIAGVLGFDTNRANILCVKDGLLTGEVEEPILGKEAKRASLIEFAKSMSLDDTLAVGDGANDLAMIEIAGLGVAYRAKPAVAAAARAAVHHGDLTSLLYLQGYHKDEFIQK